MRLTQNKVTKKAITKIIKYCQKALDDQKLTQAKAFEYKSGEIKGISISGRSLRKIFTGERIHINTITKTMKDLGIEWIINNGKIDIEDETKEDNNSEGVQGAI